MRANVQVVRPEMGMRMEQRGKNKREWRRDTKAFLEGDMTESIW